MNRRILLTGLLLALNLIVTSPSSAQTGFVPVPFVVDGMTRIAMLWVPPDYTPSKQWPLIVYLHGGSGRGDTDDAAAMREWMDRLEMVKAIRQQPERFSALVLVPRCPTGMHWTPVLPGRWAPARVTDTNPKVTALGHLARGGVGGRAGQSFG